MFHAMAPTLPASAPPPLPPHAVFSAGVPQAQNGVRATFVMDHQRIVAVSK
ncbi:MAG: hypothetical protein WA431_05870 [Candidatus Cybelea sp.]